MLEYNLNFENMFGSADINQGSVNAIKMQMDHLRTMIGSNQPRQVPAGVYGRSFMRSAGVDGYTPQEATYVGTQMRPQFERLLPKFSTAMAGVTGAQGEDEIKKSYSELTKVTKDYMNILRDTVKTSKEYRGAQEDATKAITGFGGSIVSLVSNLGRMNLAGAAGDIQGMGGGMGGLAGLAGKGMLSGGAIAAGVGGGLLMAVAAAATMGISTLAGRFESQAGSTLDYMRTLNQMGILPSRNLLGVGAKPGMYETPVTVGYDKLSLQAYGVSEIVGNTIGGMAGTYTGPIGAALIGRKINTGIGIGGTVERQEIETRSVMKEFAKSSADFGRQVGIIAQGVVRPTEGLDNKNITELVKTLNRLEVTTGTAAEQWAQTTAKMIEQRGISTQQATDELTQMYGIGKTMGMRGKEFKSWQDVSTDLARRAFLGGPGAQEPIEAMKAAVANMRNNYRPEEAANILQTMTGFTAAGLTNQKAFMTYSTIGGLSMQEMLHPWNPAVQRKLAANMGRGAREMAGGSVIPSEFMLMSLTGATPGTDLYGYFAKTAFGGAAFTGPTYDEAKKIEINRKKIVDGVKSIMGPSATINAEGSLVVDSSKWTNQEIVKKSGELKEDKDRRDLIDKGALDAASAKEWGTNLAEGFTTFLAKGALTIGKMTVMNMEPIKYTRGSENRGASIAPANR